MNYFLNFKKANKKHFSLMVICCLVMMAGIWFRCTDLNFTYTEDEVYTSFRVSGYKAGFVENAIAGRELSSEQLAQFQQPKTRTWSDTFAALLDRPEHLPLFYVLERAWAIMFGNSVVVLRSLSVVFSLLAFPAIYWFCMELFASSAIASISVALLAVSPFHLYYAQIARQYSLWTLLTLLSSAALIRVIRLKDKQSWGLFFILTVIHLYTNLLGLLTLTAQTAYALCMQRIYPALKRRYLFLSVGLSLALFSIWFLLHIYLFKSGSILQKIEGATDVFKMPRIRIFQFAALHISHNFIAFLKINYQENLPYVILLLLTLILSIYSCFSLIKNNPTRIWLLLIVTIACSALPFILDDLLDGGTATKKTRYFVPALIMFLIIMADFIVHLINKKNTYLRQSGQLLFAFFIVFGLLSSSSLDAVSRYRYRHVPAVIEYTNKIDHPIIYTSSLYNLFAMANKAEPDTKFVFLKKNFEQFSQTNFHQKNVYIFEPNEDFREYLNNDLGLKVKTVLNKENYLFQVNS